ncbi:MAG: hypothetical protein E7D27_09290 [Clostridium celatum]|nr:hypothetical protein [Clostridium celatum]
MSFIDEVKQSKINSLIEYDPTDIVNEFKEIYQNSGIDETVNKIKALEEEQNKLREEVINKWNEVELEKYSITSNIHKLKLSGDKRIELYRKIDGYMGSKQGVIQGAIKGVKKTKVSIKDVNFQDLLKNPM